MKTTLMVLLTGLAVLISLMATNYSSAIAMYGNILVLIMLLSLAYFFPFFKGNSNTALSVWDGILLVWNFGLLMRSINYLGKSFDQIDQTYILVLKLLVGAVYVFGLFTSYKRARPVEAV